MPMGFIRRGNNQVAGIDSHRTIGNRSHTGVAGHDEEKLSTRVMVPVGHRS